MIRACDLAAKIECGNFKRRMQSRTHDAGYVDALDDAWGVVLRLQSSATKKKRP